MKIFHICSDKIWTEQSESSEYIHASLAEEGFIHCSKKHQIAGVLDRYFTGQTDLIILTIDTTKIIPKLQYDEAPNGQDYPHIYGPLNKDSIIEINKINSSI